MAKECLEFSKCSKSYNYVSLLFVLFLVLLKIFFLISMTYFPLNALFFSKFLNILICKFTSLVYLELIWGYSIRKQFNFLFPCRLQIL